MAKSTQVNSQTDVEEKIIKLPSITPSCKRAAMLYKMVSLDIWGFRNVELDTEAIALAEKIKLTTGRDDGNFMNYYARCVKYTKNMWFSWHPDAPVEFTNLEEFWKMVLNGEDESECYLFYIKNISNPVSNEWQETVDEAHKIWKPTQEKTMTAKELAEKDPN